MKKTNFYSLQLTIFFVLLTMMCITLPCQAQAPGAATNSENYIGQLRSLSNPEKEILEKIAKKFPDFKYGNKMKEVSAVIPGKTRPMPIALEVVFEQLPPDYVSYLVRIDPVDEIVFYSYSMGAANSAWGSYLIEGNDVFRTEQSCGTTECSITFAKNNKLLVK